MLYRKLKNKNLELQISLTKVLCNLESQFEITDRLRRTNNQLTVENKELKEKISGLHLLIKSFLKNNEPVRKRDLKGRFV